jgi:hypothetical protein
MVSHGGEGEEVVVAPKSSNGSGLWRWGVDTRLPGMQGKATVSFGEGELQGRGRIDDGFEGHA